MGGSHPFSKTPCFQWDPEHHFSTHFAFGCRLCQCARVLLRKFLCAPTPLLHDHLFATRVFSTNHLCVCSQFLSVKFPQTSHKTLCFDRHKKGHLGQQTPHKLACSGKGRCDPTFVFVASSASLVHANALKSSQ